MINTSQNDEIININIIKYQNKHVLAITTQKGNLKLYDLLNKDKLLHKYKFSNIHDIICINNKLLVSYEYILTAFDLTEVLD